ncbi:hypothetical protein FGKAn22_14770 [Ferrigenium kumadai]|uniref:DUF2079 domain-containing protein n=1 Tax=Ferrigenium kumadai TaxID=1682490 RepID=A0AAN1VZU1_9PROT|nr:DUF2079 domain-containing protein [Ferrigenium kumadai]BBI99784.1 hypothetical protein FGKAn22_14770 [Ferrigenium kumadai]
MSRLPATRRQWLALAVISLYFLLALFLGLSRHWGYITSINDLGVFDQAVWGTMHGQFLLNTSQLDQPINWLGFHFNPVILLFVPLYAIAPYPEWFTLAQALALSLAAWPIFLLASRICRSETAGLLWVVAYLANPFLLNAAAWDFHPVSLAVPLIALALLSVEKMDRRLLFVSCLPLLLIQEQFGLTVTAFGLLWWLRNRQWKIAVGLVLVGITHTALVLGVIMPALSPTGSHVMFASELGHLSRYGWLGKSAGDMTSNLLHHPWSIAQAVLFDRLGWTYLTLLLLPFFGFPLAATVYLLPALPDLAANLLSSNPMPRSVFAYHSVTLVPVLTIAAAYSARCISRQWEWLSNAQISGLALVSSLVMGYALAPLPIAGAVNFWAPARFPVVPDPAPAAIRAALGNASASVQGNVGAHFSQRSQINTYPKKPEGVEAIVLRLESPTREISSSDPGETATLASHLQMRPAEYLASIECLLSREDFKVALWEDPWLVFSRNAMMDATVRREIELKLLRLRQEWRINADEYIAALKTCPK